MKTPSFRSWEALAAKGDERANYLVNRYKKRPAIELDDLRSDPLEAKNIAEEKGSEKVIMSLRKKLDQWMKAQGDLGQETEMNALDRQGGGRKQKKK